MNKQKKSKNIYVVENRTRAGEALSEDDLYAVNSDARVGALIKRSIKVILSENSLPIGLRSFMADEWAELQDLMQTKECDLQAVAWKVQGMILTLGWCREVCPDKSLVAQMKILDGELGMYRKSLEARTLNEFNIVAPDFENDRDLGYKSEVYG